MKMYILVLRDAPFGHAINSAAHAGCCAALRWYHDDDFRAWARTSFRKVTVRATPAELEACEAAVPSSDFIRVTESALDGQLLCVAFKPRATWPDVFKTLPLWGTN